MVDNCVLKLNEFVDGKYGVEIVEYLKKCGINSYYNIDGTYILDCVVGRCIRDRINFFSKGGPHVDTVSIITIEEFRQRIANQSNTYELW